MSLEDLLPMSSDHTYKDMLDEEGWIAQRDEAVHIEGHTFLKTVSPMPSDTG